MNTAVRISLLGLFFLLCVNAFDGGNKEDPTQVELDISEASFSEFARESKARCSVNSVGNPQTCWQDSEGKSFRYGCGAGDDMRIFTDSCSENCEECEGAWKWAGEQQGVCYDDGSNLYQYQCGVPSPSAVVVEEVTAAPSLSKSCGDLGWALQPGDLSVCGQSKVENGECPTSSSFAKAEAVCMNIGGRLCTAAELANDETKGTGCKLDCEAVWSSDSCETIDGKAGHIAGSGANKCSKHFPQTCVADSESRKYRCCADVLLSGGQAATPADFTFPEGFFPAVARDYKASDGSCGAQESISQYTCWVNPADNKAQRFACKADGSLVYAQSCGTDTDCRPSSCRGDFFTQGEMLDKCYSSGDGVLYEYSCVRQES